MNMLLWHHRTDKREERKDVLINETADNVSKDRNSVLEFALSSTKLEVFLADGDEVGDINEEQRITPEYRVRH